MYIKIRYREKKTPIQIEQMYMLLYVIRYWKINEFYRNFLDMNSSMDVDLLLKQCEHYMNEYDIMSLVKECLHKLCVHQPENPVQFLKQYFSGQPYQQVRIFFSTDVDK